MDDFSPWDIADIFRLHEAACLIAGVMPLSKRVPDREELPAQAIPAYVKLGSAYVLNWVSYHKDLPENPKCQTLKGCDEIPTLPKFEPLKKLTGEFVTRDELHRWVNAMGIKSAYSFAPVTTSPGAEQDAAPTQTSATPAPEETSGDDPAPLTTSEIAGCFAEFHGWNSDRWKINLQSPAPWLKACQHQAGRQGKPTVESTWWPVQIAQALDAKHANIRRKLHSRFKNQEPLKPWLESLETHLPDDSETFENRL